jgi:photosystem II stability/assembly factor-like uncharacterized protein
MLRNRLFGVLALLLGFSITAAAQTAAPDSAFLSGMRWRPIGPANMSGRVTDIEGLPSPSATFYVASVAGGIWKTNNAGTTFRPLFQNERVVSMGDLAIAPSDTMQIWAGTGEEDSRNSISPGGGIYKSTDGGNTWKLMGLEKTEHIGRIVVHPTNPNIVYVAALGAAWRSNPERGVYKTTDGGQTWQLVKFISNKAGFVDIVMDPRNPDVLFAASWERQRTPYSLQSGGPGSGLWKTNDGGRTWTEVTGGGFPATMKGRIGLAMAPSNSRVIYALVEASPPGKTPTSNPSGTPGNNCWNVGKGGCGLYRSTDGGTTWEWMNGNDVRPFYYSQVRVDPVNPDRVYWSSTPVNYSNDGGKTIGNATVGLHVDHHAMWIDPTNPNHFIVGNDGGIGITWDKGGTYDFTNNFPIGQFYNVSYDMRVPYWVCGGLQDNGSWCGPSRKAGSLITNHDWFTFSGGDGFGTQQDPREWWIVYGESQGGNLARRDLRTGERTQLRKPNWLDRYRAFEDSIVIERGDSARTLPPEAQRRIATLRSRQVEDSVAFNLRWNWNTPYLLSPHNPTVLYAGANRVMKSTKRGDDMEAISPDLTTRDSMKIRVSTRTTGGVTPDVTGAETHSTIVSLNESPVRAGVLYAGTDDGKVWTSPDDGRTWNDLTARFNKLVPANTYVSRIEPSRVDVNRFYVTFDNHRNGDFTPYVFATDDGGRTFRSIAGNLPRGGPDFAHVIREDPVNPNLLYVGTDVGAYVSTNRGATWQKFMNGLPTVPVHDLQIHPRDHELIAGTHGRSIWVVDVAPLQQFNAQLMAATAPVLLQPKPGLAYFDVPVGGESGGHKGFQAQSPPFGAEITYFVPKSYTPPATNAPATTTNSSSQGDAPPAPERQGRRNAAPRAQIIVLDAKGDTMQTSEGMLTPGLQRVFWPMRKRAEPPRPLSPAEKRDSALLEVRVTAVVDSLVKAGTARDTLNAALRAWRQQQRTGGGGFGGGAGGTGGSSTSMAATGGPLSGAIGVYAERPGETTPVTPGGRAPGGAGGGGGGGGFTPAGVDPELYRVLTNALRLPDRPNLRGGGGGGGGGFGAQPLVDAGSYTIILKVGDSEQKQTVRVIKP